MDLWFGAAARIKHGVRGESANAAGCKPAISRGGTGRTLLTPSSPGGTGNRFVNGTLGVRIPSTAPLIRVHSTAGCRTVNAVMLVRIQHPEPNEFHVPSSRFQVAGDAVYLERGTWNLELTSGRWCNRRTRRPLTPKSTGSNPVRPAKARSSTSQDATLSRSRSGGGTRTGLHDVGASEGRRVGAGRAMRTRDEGQETRDFGGPRTL